MREALGLIPAQKKRKDKKKKKDVYGYTYGRICDFID
jgi:hypothetical protein